MGSAVEKYPDIVKQIADDGHLIGNHTFHHVGLENADTALIESEVVSANELIEKIAGERPQFIRTTSGSNFTRLAAAVTKQAVRGKSTTIIVESEAE